jgi:hypothetical protein
LVVGVGEELILPRVLVVVDLLHQLVQYQLLLVHTQSLLVLVVDQHLMVERLLLHQILLEEE